VENVWSRVVIICKKIHEPDLPFQGAKEAVEMALREEVEGNFGAKFNSEEIPCLGYTIFSDPHVQGRINKYRKEHQRRCLRSVDATNQHVDVDDTNLHLLEPHQFCRRCFNAGENAFESCSSDTCTANRENLFDLLYIKTDADVRAEVHGVLDTFEQIEIEYRTQRCRACGVVTDARLMPYKCHTTSRLTHGEVLSRHSKAGARFHTGREPPYHKEEGTPRFSGTKFSCCGKTERSFWKDKLLKNSGCQNTWSCCGGEKNSNGCSSVEQHLCCQLGKKTHMSAPVRRHIPVTEFPNPGWGFNPFNWDLGGMWTVQYRYVCGHEMSSPGCRHFYPCCHRFEGEDGGGCSLQDSPGCEDYCQWCEKDPRLDKEGCRHVCITCGGLWGEVEGCTNLPELKTHDVEDLE